MPIPKARSIAFCFVLLLLIACQPSKDPSPTPDGTTPDLRPLLETLIGGQLGTGASLTIFEGGELSTSTAGVIYEGGPPVEEGTPFNVASVSKLVTAAVVLELAAQGRIDLRDSVHHHLPGVHLIDSSGKERSGEVTLEMLLSHRGGLPHQPTSLDPASFGSSWVDPHLLRKLTENWTIPLAGNPGAYLYSNMGYALLGAIVEKLEGNSFSEAVQPWLEDYGMGDASSGPPSHREGAHGRVKGALSFHFNEPQWYGSRYAAPFTGLWASSRDLARFGAGLIPSSFDPGSALYELARTDNGEGHGIGAIRRRRHGHMTVEHDGGSPGFLSALIVIPERRLALAVVCNGDGEVRKNALEFAKVVDQVVELVLSKKAG